MKIHPFIAPVLIAVILITCGCSGVDINDETDVMKGIQGTWIGYEKSGNLYRHIKLIIKENSFEGWLQTSDSVNDPTWTILPIESGTFSLSSVQESDSGQDKFRSLNFSIHGRCCGDNSLTAKTLSELITYKSKKGLLVGDELSMIRVR